MADILEIFELRAGTDKLKQDVKEASQIISDIKSPPVKITANITDVQTKADKAESEIKGINNKIEITADTSKLKASLESIKGSAKDAFSAFKGGDLDSAKSGILGLTSNIASMAGPWGAVAAGAVAAGGAILKVVTDTAKLQKEVKTLTGLTGEALGSLTASVSATSDTFDVEFNDVLSAANVLSKQMGISFDEAMAAINNGLANGANANGEFLEQLKEYPTFFKSAGLSAQQMGTYIANATKQGIFSDKAGDLVKESVLRFREMTQGTKDAMAGIGISGDEIQKQLQNGTINIFQAMQKVTAAMSKLPKDSAAVGTAIADIFGGPGEDVGYDFLVNLQNIDLATKDLTKSSDPFIRQQQTELQLRQKWNDIVNKATTVIYPALIKLFDFFLNLIQDITNLDFGGWFNLLFNPITRIKNILQLLQAIFGDFINNLFPGFNDNLTKLIRWFTDLEKSISSGVNTFISWAGSLLGLTNENEKNTKAVNTNTKAKKQNAEATKELTAEQKKEHQENIRVQKILTDSGLKYSQTQQSISDLKKAIASTKDRNILKDLNEQLKALQPSTQQANESLSQLIDKYVSAGGTLEKLNNTDLPTFKQFMGKNDEEKSKAEEIKKINDELERLRNLPAVVARAKTVTKVESETVTSYKTGKSAAMEIAFVPVITDEESALIQFEKLKSKIQESAAGIADIDVFNGEGIANEISGVLQLIKLQNVLQEAEKKTEEGRKEQQKAALTRSEATKQALFDLGKGIGETMAQFMTGQIKTIGDFGKALLGIAIDVVQKLILTYTPAIMTQFVTWFGPIYGLVAGGAFIGLVSGLLAAAKSKVGAEQGVVGIKKSYNKKAGKTDTIPLWVAEGEGIMSKTAVDARGRLVSNKEALEFANKGLPIETLFLQKLQGHNVPYYNNNINVQGLEQRLDLISHELNVIKRTNIYMADNVNKQAPIKLNNVVNLKNEYWR